jgi:serine/threonine protein kinase
MQQRFCPKCGKTFQPGDEACRYCGFVFPFSTNLLSPGTVLQNRYELQEMVHTGGMGYVYLAKDKRLYDRLCIVKQVKEPIQNETHRKKLEEEALRMAKLNHPNIALIFDHFVENNYYFLVVERIAGKTLSEVYKDRQGRLTEGEVVKWATVICDVVSYIHKEGIVHRDISPDNIMLTGEGVIKFIDFGTLREFRNINQGTAGMGKYGYAPPEQWQGKPEPRSDLFALGATLYYLLSGFLPLSKQYTTGQGPQRDDFYPVFPLIRTRNPNISPELESVLQKALQLDINNRFKSAAEFELALRGLNQPGVFSGQSQPAATGGRPAAQPTTIARPLPQYKKKNRSKLWMVIVFPLIAAAGIGLFYLLNNPPPEWQEFSSQEGRFSVMMPGKPQPEAMDTGSGITGGKIFTVDTGGIFYGVAYSDYESNIVSGQTTDQLLNGAKEGVLYNTEGDLLSDNEIWIDSYPGKELRVQAPDNMLLRQRLYLVENRLYQVIIVTDNETAYAADIDKFVQSFKLIGATGTSTTAPSIGTISEIADNKATPDTALPGGQLNGPVAYYPFNGNAKDESGTGNDGTVYGASLIADRAGHPGSAYSFNGNDNYIDIGNDISLKMADGWTVAVWVNASSYSPQYQNIISDHAPEGPFEERAFRFCGDRLQFIVGGNYGHGSSVYCEYSLPPNTLNIWHHLVGTYDRKQARLYVDGVMVSSIDAVNPVPVNDLPVLIGKSGWGEFFNGSLDEIYIYNRAISESKIQELYSGKGPSSSGVPTSLTAGQLKIFGPWTTEIYIDGNQAGTIGSSDTSVTDVLPGTHTVTLTKSGSKEWTKQVNVVTGQTTTLYAYFESGSGTSSCRNETITPGSLAAYGSIKVYAPWTTNIYVGGEPGGTIGSSDTSTVSGISPGTYTVKLTKSGCKEWTKQVTVTTDQVTTIYAYPEPGSGISSCRNETITPDSLSRYGSLTVNAPWTTNIYIGGEPGGTIGSSDTATVDGILPGTYTLKLTRSGYKDWTGQVTIVTGQTAVVNATLTK